MNYETRILSYFDLLGWKEFIRESTRDPSLLTDIETVVKAAEPLMSQFKADAQVQFAQFSDHICISVPDGVGAMRVACTMTIALSIKIIQLGHLVRGAIVRGPLIHRQNQIYGPALIEAHEIESRVAKYPRIVFSKQAKELAVTLEGQYQNRVLREDFDGLSHLHLFGNPDQVQARNHLNAALCGFRRPSKEVADLDVQAKRSWLEKYLAETADKVGVSMPSRSGVGEADAG